MAPLTTGKPYIKTHADSLPKTKRIHILKEGYPPIPLHGTRPIRGHFPQESAVSPAFRPTQADPAFRLRTLFSAGLSDSVPGISFRMY